MANLATSSAESRFYAYGFF